jgi:large subunit ribosomal protein L21
MSKLAVIKISGSQSKVSEGDEIEVAKIEGKEGDLLTFKEVLLLATEKEVKVGQPLVADAQVKAKILVQKKGSKIRVAVFKAKSRYRRVKGFRPRLTRIKIEKITS